MQETLLATNESQATLRQHLADDLQVAVGRRQGKVLHLRHNYKVNDVCEASVHHQNGTANKVRNSILRVIDCK